MKVKHSDCFDFSGSGFRRCSTLTEISVPSECLILAGLCLYSYIAMGNNYYFAFFPSNKKWSCYSRLFCLKMENMIMLNVSLLKLILNITY